MLGNSTGGGGGGGGGLAGCDTIAILESLCLDNAYDIIGPYLYVIEALVIIYSFCGLAMVCDDYLAVSLETLCDRWDVREDVAGASFMAFGSAAPEIIINLITTLKSLHQQQREQHHHHQENNQNIVSYGSDKGKTGQDDGEMDVVQLGCSAILGSGLIAFLVIPGVCALSAENELQLKRRPLLRDVLCYSCSLALLCMFIRDGVITVVEGAILVSLYGFYLTVVITAPYVRRSYHAFVLGRDLLHTNFVRKQREANKKQKLEERKKAREAYNGDVRMVHPGSENKGSTTPTSPASPTSPSASMNRTLSFESGLQETIGKLHLDTSNEHEVIPQTYHDIHQARQAKGEFGSIFKNPGRASFADAHRSSYHSLSGSTRGSFPGLDDPLIDSEEEEELSTMGRAYKTFVAPLRFMFQCTCPDCEIDGPREAWYPVTFIMSFLWVAIFSFIISTIVGTWANHTSLTPSFFGLYLISIGAEVPDTIQSVTVARRGFGSMAVSNSTGSQIVNILIGLGLPWFLSALAGFPIQIHGHGTYSPCSLSLSLSLYLSP